MSFFSRVKVTLLVIAIIGLSLFFAIRPAAHASGSNGIPSSKGPSWPMFGFLPHHGFYNPKEHILSPSNVSQLTLDWTANTTNTFSNSSPAMADGMVFVPSNDGYLYALNAQTGATVWTTNMGEGPSLSSPAVAEGLVFIGSDNRNFYAFNEMSGQLVWSVMLPAYEYSSPVISNGVVYIADNNLYAFNAKNGSVLWIYPGNAFNSSSAAIANGIVYAGSGDHNIYAINAKTGTVLWTAPTGGVVESSPSVVNGVVYICSDDGYLYALKASTGTKLWTAPINADFPEPESPAVAKGVVYVGAAYGGRGAMMAFNAGTGALLWNHTLYGSSGTASIANNVLYVSVSDHNIYALDARSGQELWNYTTGAPVTSTPIVVQGIVYLNATDGNLYAFHL